MTELVRVTTELQHVRGLECRVPNKRALIAALYKIGAVCGASEAEVAQLIELFEGWQRANYTRHLLSRWSYDGRIAEQASLSEWHLPMHKFEQREQLPAWVQNLCFRVERQDGEIVLKDLEHKGVAYADLAAALGVNSEPPASGAQIRMVLPRAHKGWNFVQPTGMVLPLQPFMAVLNWFFEEPCVQFLEDERREYAEEHDLVLDESKIELWQTQDDVAPYAAWLESPRELGEYLEKRFTAGDQGREIDFAEDVSEPPRRKHAYLAADGFSVNLELVHPNDSSVKEYHAPSIIRDDYGYSGECCLNMAPRNFYWESADDSWDVALIELTFGFLAARPCTLEHKPAFQHFVDEFAAKLREHFEPVMLTLQSPPPEEY